MTKEQALKKASLEFTKVCVKIEDYANRYERGLDECGEHKCIQRWQYQAYVLREKRDAIKYFWEEEAA
jgi:hypothetical protein